MLLRKYGGSSRSTALPTTDLYAQFDANDTTSHTPASGLWSPTSGADTVDLVAKDSSSVTQTFSYGTNQAGKRTIDCPVGIEFRPASTSATTYADVTVLMALRIGSSGRVMSIGQNGGDYSRWEPASDNQWQITDSLGIETRLNKTDIAAGDGSFRILGLCWSDTVGKVTPLSSGLFDESGNTYTAANMAAALLRSADTSYGGTMHINSSYTIDCEIGEILIYSNADLGQAIQAVKYLSDRWRVTT